MPIPPSQLGAVDIDVFWKNGWPIAEYAGARIGMF